MGARSGHDSHGAIHHVTAAFGLVPRGDHRGARAIVLGRSWLRAVDRKKDAESRAWTTRATCAEGARVGIPIHEIVRLGQAVTDAGADRVVEKGPLGGGGTCLFFRAGAGAGDRGIDRSAVQRRERLRVGGNRDCRRCDGRGGRREGRGRCGRRDGRGRAAGTTSARAPHRTPRTNPILEDAAAPATRSPSHGRARMAR